MNQPTTTPTTTTPSRQARGIALAEQGAVSASLDPNTWYIQGSPIGSGPDVLRPLYEIQRTGKVFHCSCRDFELHEAAPAPEPEPTPEPEPQPAPAPAWRVVVIHEKLRTWAHCRAYAPGVAATEKAALCAI